MCIHQYQVLIPGLALEEHLPQGFTVFTLPAVHQQRMRTSNALERVNQELKHRTRVARVPTNHRFCAWSPRSWSKPAMNGKPE